MSNLLVGWKWRIFQKVGYYLASMDRGNLTFAGSALKNKYHRIKKSQLKVSSLLHLIPTPTPTLSFITL